MSAGTNPPSIDKIVLDRLDEIDGHLTMQDVQIADVKRIVAESGLNGHTHLLKEWLEKRADNEAFWSLARKKFAFLGHPMRWGKWLLVSGTSAGLAGLGLILAQKILGGHA